jgi:uncharacterized membrane protein
MAANNQTTPEATTDAPRPKKQIFRALEAKSLRNRSIATQFADFLTGITSTPTFLFLNALFFVVWIVLNTNIVPGFEPFDPYPFGLLTMAVSLEAIFLSIFVLVSQNRAAQIATLRDELNLRVNLIAEREVTKILQMLVDMRKKMKLYEVDEELEFMLKNIDTNDLEQVILQQIERAGQSSSRRKLTKDEFSTIITSLLKPKK